MLGSKKTVLIGIGASLLAIGGTIAVYAQTTTGTFIETSNALLAQITLFLGAIAGILGVLIPHLKGKAREYAEKVANYVEQTDNWVLKVEEASKTNKERVQILEEVVLNLAKVTPEAKAKYEDYKAKVIEAENQIKSEVERDTVELEKARTALSELLGK